MKLYTTGTVDNQEEEEILVYTIHCNNCEWNSVITDKDNKKCPKCGSENINILFIRYGTL